MGKRIYNSRPQVCNGKFNQPSQSATYPSRCGKDCGTVWRLWARLSHKFRHERTHRSLLPPFLWRSPFVSPQIKINTRFFPVFIAKTCLGRRFPFTLMGQPQQPRGRRALSLLGDPRFLSGGRQRVLASTKIGEGQNGRINIWNIFTLPYFALSFRSAPL